MARISVGWLGEHCGFIREEEGRQTLLGSPFAPAPEPGDILRFGFVFLDQDIWRVVYCQRQGQAQWEELGRLRWESSEELTPPTWIVDEDVWKRRHRQEET